VSRLVDAGVWQLSLGHKTCRHNPKGFRGVGTAETRLDSQGQLSEDSSSRDGTAGTEASEQRIILSPSPSRSFSACSVHAPKHHPFTIPLLPQKYPIHNTNTPNPGHTLPCQTRAPASHCTPAATSSTSNPPHRLSRSANCGTAAPHRPPYHPARATCVPWSCSSLPFPRRFRLCTRIAYCCSPGHVSTNTDYANDVPRLGWAWTPDVPHSRRRLTSALWTTRAALELKSLPT
jgi:hypothetical protein